MQSWGPMTLLSKGLLRERAGNLACLLQEAQQSSKENPQKRSNENRSNDTRHSVLRITYITWRKRKRQMTLGAHSLFIPHDATPYHIKIRERNSLLYRFSSREPGVASANLPVELLSGSTNRVLHGVLSGPADCGELSFSERNYREGTSTSFLLMKMGKAVRRFEERDINWTLLNRKRRGKRAVLLPHSTTIVTANNNNGSIKTGKRDLVTIGDQHP
eukprot:scaffold22653_cov119-Cylindrotheca_fusiformis.AAC.6